MNIKAAVLGLVLSLIGIYFFANDHEQGDANAIGMYFLVFFFPVFIIAIINSIYVRVLEKKCSMKTKAMLCFIPVILLVILCLPDYWTIPGFDGNMTFAALAGAIAIGITNLLWLSFQESKSK